jgi:hypothetical protein
MAAACDDRGNGPAQNGVALLTDNTKDFPMKELKLYLLPN